MAITEQYLLAFKLQVQALALLDRIHEIDDCTNPRITCIRRRSYARWDRRERRASTLYDVIKNKVIASAVDCDAFLNSGDSARHPAGAPVLTNSQPEKLSSDEVGQGGNPFTPPPSCLALESRFSYSCDCPECRRFNALMLSEIDLCHELQIL